MKTLAGSARFLAKLALLALAVVVATLAPAQDSRRVGADHSELYIALSSASSNHLNSLFFVVGSEERTVYVRAKDVTHDPSGVGAFQLTLVYDNDVVSVTSIEPDLIWLGSTGRLASCSNSTIGAISGDPDGLWEVVVGCGTAGSSLSGAQGSGLLASITLKPASVPGTGPLTNLSFLVDTTGAAAHLPVTLRSTSVVVAHCGDIAPLPILDGVVSVGDIGMMVSHFSETPASPNWYENADLNGDGVISVGDLGLVVIQFTTLCSD